MDSLTQAVLGAAVGEVILGKQLGWRAAAWGTFFGSLPDFDIFAYPYLSEAQQLRWHRGISHSILVMVLASFLLAKPLSLIHRRRKRAVGCRRAGWMVFWVWSTHVLIDCFTTYGTQIFEPFSDERVSFNNLSIIDPLFTLPLLLGLIIALFHEVGSTKRQRVMRQCIALSCLYVLFSFAMKFWATKNITEQMEHDFPDAKLVAVAPATFSTILWRGLIESDEGYYISYWSPFDQEAGMPDYLAKRRELAADYKGQEVFEALKWFSRDHWIARKGSDGRTIFIDVRFSEIRDRHSGLFHPIFQWHLTPVAEIMDGKEVAPMRRPKNLDYWGALKLYWKRMGGDLEEWQRFRAY